MIRIAVESSLLIYAGADWRPIFLGNSGLRSIAVNTSLRPKTETIRMV